MDNATFLINTAKFLATQKTRSVSADGYVCRYAGPDGNACGIGCHLPRGLAERLDALPCSAWSDIVDYANGEGGFSGLAKEAVAALGEVDPGLAGEVQDIHDKTNRGRSLEERGQMLEELSRLAARLQLFRAQAEIDAIFIPYL